MPQRWLILTSSTGSGHDTRAYALQDWAKHLHGEEVEVTVWHVLEETSFWGRFGVWLYNVIQRHCPALHQVFWQVTEVWNWVNRWMMPLFDGPIRKRLRAERPHLVISMHDSLNAAYFSAVRRELGKDHVRCAIYCGEWSAGFGFSWHWIDASVDLFVGRTQEVANLARRRGIPAAKIRVFRNLLRVGDFEPRLDPNRRAEARRELGLEPARFTVLLASGALGADRHHRMLDALCALGDRIQAVALCGRNEAAHRQTEAWAKAHPEMMVSIHGYTDDTPRLFQVADCVLTRGGANTMAECVHYRRPVLFHTERGIMPQEYCTRRFLLQRGIGQLVPRRAQLVEVLREWVDQPQSYEAVVAKFDGIADGGHPERLVAELRALASEVG